MKQSVTKNTTYISLAFALQKGLALIYFLVLASRLSPDRLGVYTSALSFALLFAIIVDLGMTNVLVRETAKCEDDAQALLSNTLGMRVVLGALAYALLVGTAVVLGYTPEKQILIAIGGIFMLTDAVHLTFYGVLRAWGNLTFEAVGILGSQLLTLVIGIGAVFLDLPLVALMLAFLIPSTCNALYAGYIIARKLGLSLRPTWQRAWVIKIIRISIPFALAGVFARVYSFIDSAILLPVLAGDEAVALYSLPYKITFAFQFIPAAFIAALYPRFSRLFATDHVALKQAFTESLRILMLIAVPLAIGIGVLAPQIIMLINPQYVASIRVLQMLIGSLVFFFLSYPVGALLNACDKQHIQTAIVGGTMLINIVLNVLLIPSLGIMGAAIAACAGNAALMLVGYWYSQRIVDVRETGLLMHMSKILIAGSCMGILVYMTGQVLPASLPLALSVIPQVVVGAVVYLVLIWVFRVVTTTDLAEMRMLVKKTSK
jgi:O-antigen/teichoic acid export membrane protein